MKQIKDADAVKRKRVGIVVVGDRRPPQHPGDILYDGKKVGRVTSGSVSPILNQGIGMAYIDKPHNGLKATGLYMEIRGKKVELKVAKMPFVPTKYYTGGKQ